MEGTVLCDVFLSLNTSMMPSFVVIPQVSAKYQEWLLYPNKQWMPLACLHSASNILLVVMP